MPANAVVGLKPDQDHARLIDLTVSVVQPGAKLHLVSLVQVSKESDERERLEATQTRIGELAERLRADGFEVEVVVQISAIGLGAELARIADDRGADLLVIGLAKRSRVGKALLGSDAQSAIMQATCPVLATRLG